MFGGRGIGLRLSSPERGTPEPSISAGTLRAADLLRDRWRRITFTNAPLLQKPPLKLQGNVRVMGSDGTSF